MPDNTPDISSLVVPDYLRQYIEAIVNDVLVEGKSFEGKKTYLQRYCETENVNYASLEGNLSSLFQAAQMLQANDSQTIDAFIAIGKDCFLSEEFLDNVLSLYINPVCEKREGTKLFRILKRKRFGFVDNLGKVVVGPRYSDAHDYSEGLAAVKDGNLWGFINIDGEMIIPPQFEKVGDFHESRAAVFCNQFWGYINQNGVLDIPCQYHEAGDFSEGLAPVRKNRKWGYIDKHGERKIELQFNEAYSFRDGLARVGKGSPNQYGFINKKGIFVINPVLKYARDFSEERVFVQHGEDKSQYYCFLDNTGHQALLCKWSFADDFHEGLACVSTKGEFGFINESGQFAIRPQFDDATRFSEGYAAVKMGNLWGYIDKKGERVVSPQFLEAAPFQDGFAIVNNESGYCVIDKTGKITATDIYTEHLTNTKDVLKKADVEAGIKHEEEQKIKELKVFHHTLLCASVVLVTIIEFFTFDKWGWAIVPAIANIFYTLFRVDYVNDVYYEKVKMGAEFALSLIPFIIINVVAFRFENGWTFLAIPILIISCIIGLAVHDDL